MKRVFYFDFVSFLLSLGFGLIWFFGGGFMYKLLINLDVGPLDIIWGPLVVAIYITGLALCLFGAIMLSNAIRNSAHPTASNLKKSFIVIAAIFVLSMLFEFVYEFKFGEIKVSKGNDASSYIFLIDDSGSMSGYDPKNERKKAVYNVVSECDKNFEFAVYCFGNGCKMALDMTKAKDADEDEDYITVVGTEKTETIEALNCILDDLESDKLDGGKHPYIILISDGFPDTDAGKDEVIDRCNDENVTIMSVGFAGADKKFMDDLSDGTGGEFCFVDDVDNLSEEMGSLIYKGATADRTLLSIRNESGIPFLYGLMRIVFMLILAFGFVLIKTFIFSTFDKSNVALIMFSVFAGLGAIFLEVGMLISKHMFILGSPFESFVRFVFVMFLIVLFGTTKNTDIDNNPYGNASTPSTFGGFDSSYGATGDKWTH